MNKANISEVPLASYHSQVLTSDGAEVGNHVVTAVDISKSGVKRNVKGVDLVIVAEQTLEECLVGEVEACKIVVRAVNECKVGAAFYVKSGKVII